MANSGDFASLDKMIESLRSMDTLVQEGAPIAARNIEAALKSTVSAGQAPDGTPWPDKVTGGKALKNAAAAITVRVVGASIVIVLKGVEVFHHFGAGVPRRQIIPQGKMPEKLGNAVRLGFVAPWRKRVGK
jgi:hypothetical protein